MTRLPVPIILVVLLAAQLRLVAQDEAVWVLVDHGRVLTADAARSEGYFERDGTWLEKRWKKKVAGWERIDRKHSEWSDPWKTKSKHYRIITNLPAHLVETEVSPFLDALFEAYGKFFKDEFGIAARSADNKFINVHKSIEDYAVNTGGRSVEEARYNPGFIQGGSELVVYYDRDEPEVFFNTVMHESAHQYIQALYPGAAFPIWIDEGLATYFEGCQYSRSRQEFIVGHLPTERLLSAQHSLDENPGASIGKLFLNVPRTRFGAREYALAWSFIHYLTHGEGGKWRRHFVTFLKEMNGAGTKLSPSEVFAKISGKSFAELEEPWKAHVRALKGTRPECWVVGVEGDAAALASFRLQPGDRIIQLDGQNVVNAEHFAELWSGLAEGAEIALVLSRKTDAGRSRVGVITRKEGEQAPAVRNMISREGSLID